MKFMESKKLLLYTIICLIFCRCECKNRTKTIYKHRNLAKEVPYLVLVTSEGDRWCTGALISKHHVITSAHCVRSVYGYVRLAVSKYPEDDISVLCYFHLHTLYSMRSDFQSSILYNYDIAIGIVKEPIKFNEYLKPINVELTEWPNNQTTNRTCLFSGFRNIPKKNFTIINKFTRYKSKKRLIKYDPNSCGCIPSIHTICIKIGPKLCSEEYGTLLICDDKLVGVHTNRLPADICKRYTSTNSLNWDTSKCLSEASIDIFTYLPSQKIFLQQFDRLFFQQIPSAAAAFDYKKYHKIILLAILFCILNS